MSTNIFYDTEFLDDGLTIDFISIGMVADDGREYYAVNADFQMHRLWNDEWMMTNVVAHLPVVPVVDSEADSRVRAELNLLDASVKPKWVIANEVRDFILAKPFPHLWAYYAAYDHVALAQLFGPMIKLPDGVPMFTRELMQIANGNHLAKCDKVFKDAYPQSKDEHHALRDAQWNRVLHGIATEKAS